MPPTSASPASSSSAALHLSAVSRLRMYDETLASSSPVMYLQGVDGLV